MESDLSFERKGKHRNKGPGVDYVSFQARKKRSRSKKGGENIDKVIDWTEESFKKSVR